MTHLRRVLAEKSVTTLRLSLCFFLSAGFLIALANRDRLRLSFLSLSEFFPFPNFLRSPRFFVLCVRVVLFSPIRLGGFSDGMADSSSAVDRRDPPPYSLVEYI